MERAKHWRREGVLNAVMPGRGLERAAPNTDLLFLMEKLDVNP